MVKSRKWEN